MFCCYGVVLCFGHLLSSTFMLCVFLFVIPLFTLDALCCMKEVISELSLSLISGLFSQQIFCLSLLDVVFVCMQNDACW